MAGVEDINRSREVYRRNQELMRINNHNISENDTLRRFLTIKQVCAILGDDEKPLSQDTIRNYIREDYKIRNGFKLKSFKLGGNVLIHADELVEFIENCSGRKVPYSK